jgi:hypothetical protein
MSAAGRVNRPMTKSAPPISSRTPAAPTIVIGEMPVNWLAGKPKNFDVPW